MKKIFLTLFAVALTASVFIACDKDDDKDKKSKEQVTSGQSVEVLQSRLDLIKAFIS